MRNKPTRFTLKLSRERIQLLLENEPHQYQEIGSADPNSSQITQNLQSLRNQVFALTGEQPVIDVMLPDELILVQNLTIESASKPISSTRAIELISKACALDKNAINVAVGSPTSHRTQPVAAVTAKTLNETRYFLNNAGFETCKFIASHPMNGFERAPVFAQNTPRKKPTIGITGSIITSAILTVFLILILSLISPLNPFKPANFTEQLNTSTPPNITPDIHFDINKAENKRLLISTNVIPDINGNKPLNLPKFSSISAMNAPSLLEDISGKSNTKPVTFPDLFSNTNLVPSKLPYRIAASINSISQFGGKYNPSSMRYLPFSSSPSHLLSQKSKLQALKSSIQYEYLKSIKPQFDKFEYSSKIEKTLSLKPPSVQTKKHSNKSKIFPKPKLSLLEKVKLNFSNTGIPRDSQMHRRLIKSQQEILSPSQKNFARLENPKEIFNQAKDIKTLSNYSFTNSNFNELSPEELLLSKKYEPIFRPNIIARINVLKEPTLSSGAITLSIDPMLRPSLFSNLSQINPKDVQIVARATKKPSFPRRASIINNATISDIIELNRTNLIGIFGTKQNAIALIRLSSGRLIKVRVGDKFDGWKVLTIYEDKIELANGNKQETLRLPG